MYRLAICDDDGHFSRQLAQMLEQWPEKPEHLNLFVFEDADSLLSAHNTNPFDIIILDVIMPLLNGIQAARELRQQDRDVKLVFLTSSPDFAVESYTVKANNYLLKPPQPEQLYRCLQELFQQIEQDAKTITVKSNKALRRIPVKQIEYIEAQNKQVIFVLTDGRIIQVTEPLYNFEGQLLLSDGFYKCSRSYIVNINRIETYTPKEICMRSGCRIAIARSHWKDFEAAYFEVLFGNAGDQ